MIGRVDEGVRERPFERRRSGRQPPVERHGGLDRVARVRREHLARGEVDAVVAAHDRAGPRIDDRVVDLARRDRGEHAPAEPGAVSVLVERQRGPAAVRERRHPLGAAGAARHRDLRAPDRRVGALGAHGRLDRRHLEVRRGRARHAEQAAGGGHRRLQLRVGRGDPAVALLPRQVLDPVRARAAGEPEGVEVAAVEAEDFRAVAHVAERDVRRARRAGTRQEAVELRDRPRRAGARLPRDQAEAPEPLAQRGAARPLLPARPRVEVAPLRRVRRGRRGERQQRRHGDERARAGACGNGGRDQDGTSSERARTTASRARGSRTRVGRSHRITTPLSRKGLTPFGTIDCPDN